MSFVFIDYADRNDLGKEKALPIKRAGKFVQIRHDDMEYLIFSPKELTPYHANIVERFCRENALNGSYVGEEKRFAIYEPRWAVAGGGKFEIDGQVGFIRLYDNSMAYGRFDAVGLREKLSTIEELKRYNVRIE